MGFGNPPVPWSEVHHRLSDQPGPPVDGSRWANGGDGDERERARRRAAPTVAPAPPEWANGGEAAPVDPWDAVRVLEVLEQVRSVRQDS